MEISIIHILGKPPLCSNDQKYKDPDYSWGIYSELFVWNVIIMRTRSQHQENEQHDRYIRNSLW